MMSLILALLALSASRVEAEPEMIPLDIFESTSLRAPIDDVPLALRDGGTFRMAEHRGSVVLLTFWASWCSPCRRELPALGEFARKHPALHVLAVNVDRVRSDAEQFLTRIHFQLPVAFDPESRVLGAYGVTSMPTMLLYDRQGALIWQHSGFSEERGFSELEEALGGAR